MIARTLEPRDLQAARALRLEGIRLFPAAFLLTEAEAEAATDGALLAWINRGDAQGVFHNDTLIGLSGLSTPTISQVRHRAQLGPFYVTPAHHGTDAADLLITQALQTARARDATQVELQVAAANPRARAFYARHGFVKTGHIPAAVVQNGIPLDDLLMTADLAVSPKEQGPDGLRRLHSGDWRIFRDIRVKMLRDSPRCFGSPASEWEAKAPDEIMEWLETLHLWAVVEEGKVAATAGWHPTGGPVTCHRGHVIAVYTAPHARGRGLSRQVLDKVAEEAAAQGIMQLELDVGAENAPAIAVYQAAGFAITGTIPNCLNHDGYIHDQYLMIRPLVA